jgi:hypothetical protein
VDTCFKVTFRRSIRASLLYLLWGEGGTSAKFGLHATNKKCNTPNVEGISKRKYVCIILPACFSTGLNQGTSYIYSHSPRNFA